MPTATPIERLAGRTAGRSAGSAYGGLAWSAATASDKKADLVAQARDVFAKTEQQLRDLGSDKVRIISATVWLADLGQKPVFDQEWSRWVGTDPAGWPQRACVGATLADGSLVEMAVVAAR